MIKVFLQLIKSLLYVRVYNMFFYSKFEIFFWRIWLSRRYLFRCFVLFKLSSCNYSCLSSYCSPLIFYFSIESSGNNLCKEFCLKVSQPEGCLYRVPVMPQTRLIDLKKYILQLNWLGSLIFSYILIDTYFLMSNELLVQWPVLQLLEEITNSFI